MADGNPFECSNCNYSGWYGDEFLMIQNHRVPDDKDDENYDLQFSVLHCRQCGDAQFLRTRGCLDESRRDHFLERLEEFFIDNAQCEFCDCDEMKICTADDNTRHEWGFKIMACCDKCGKGKDSRFFDLVTICGAKLEDDLWELNKDKKPGPPISPLYEIAEKSVGSGTLWKSRKD
ncbi:MAG: hypothetical protein QF365_03410 [Candidatus Thalassarchaeaceae archaeon]|jgi:hypothetical protein|nr:hypothetical protein [Candidatus Thalassarchaeaceae archaeon]